MAKEKTCYVCASCGYETARWLGCCPDCGEWNTFEERKTVSPISVASKTAEKAARYQTTQKTEPIPLSKVQERSMPRSSTGNEELDRVLGGGLVPGSAILIGGDPGIGKSTLLLQVAGSLSQQCRVLYVSGEESAHQIKMRASRIGVPQDALYVLTENDVESVLEKCGRLQPDVLIIDSIQTMVSQDSASAPGSVSQVRQSAGAIVRFAKETGTSVFIVGHVTKEGSLAGPRVLEHMVDAVLYFEGERNLSYRILRAIKNRYGSTNEIGVFEMGDSGLDEVSNPSQAMLEGRPENVSGTCVACVIEGSRPILAEVQALVSKSGYPSPRRMATGFDYNRLALLLAVLEKRCGYFFGTLDAYINVVGGLRLDEPAADLPVALALVSNLTDKPIPEDLIAFGEVGLAGELRAVNRVQMRIKEARRLGFKRCLLPKSSLSAINFDPGIELIGVSSLSQALSAALAGA